MYDQRLGSLASFLQPRRAITAGHPKTSSFPSCAGVIDAALQSLCVEAQRVGNAECYEFAGDQGMHAVEEVAGRDRYVRAQSQRVVLIDPSVVARLDAELRQAREPRAR